MPTDPRVIAAFQAMKALGIPQEKVKPVLKNLLRVYEKNWQLIEAESYRVLVDAIFEAEDTAIEEKKKRKCVNQEDNAEEEELGHEPECPLKRLRLRGREVNQPPNMAELPESKAEHCQVSPQNAMRDKGKQPMVVDESLTLYAPPIFGKNLISERAAPQGLCLKGPMTESEEVLPKYNVADTYQLVEPKDEPFSDDMFINDIPHYSAPIAVIHPEKDPLAIENVRQRNNNDLVKEMNILVGSGETDAEVGKDSALQSKERRFGGFSNSLRDMGAKYDATLVQEEPFSYLDVATSPLGEVKLSLLCNSAVGRRKFRMPTLDAVIKMTEEKCLHSYKIVDPKFSVMKLLRHVCESFLELGTDSIHESQGRPNGTKHVSSNVDAHKISIPLDAFGDNRENSDVPLQKLVGSEPNVVEANSQDDHAQSSKKTLQTNIGSAMEDKDGESGDPKSRNGCNLGIFPLNEPASNDLRSHDDVEDLTRGEESIRIPWINEMNYECPVFFRYISQGLVFQNAKLDVSLSGIGDLSCCSTCFGDCLSAPVTCACAKDTGGEYAYTTEGVVKEVFLEECISMTRDPQHQCPIFCEECPLEKKNDDCLEPCKGHVQRKFIKECWKKCGCNKKCGNRIVQRGITRNLQVFFTSDERGWGLRTLEELPKGTFVCEYVGEILTIAESRERTMNSDKSGRNTYLAILDADWGSRRSLKDEKALCLDASQYGNVARFINHRCLDANLVEIPVEVETPDHHYYHVAFFTTRKVDALEELTRDYGIEFDDHDHPMKPFVCHCGSKFCRDIKRQNRPKSTPTAS